uniref:C-C motif chemokine n=1 Tax=Pygocentrus nattereri TaxID=42514 RepID=A0AAR2J4R2_PYGNA
MKPYSIAAIGVLLFAFCSVTISQSKFTLSFSDNILMLLQIIYHGPQKCCFSYTKTKIPVAMVMHFEMTSPACNKPGVIFHTTKQIEKCADPEEKWVQRLINIKS